MTEEQSRVNYHKTEEPVIRREESSKQNLFALEEDWIQDIQKFRILAHESKYQCTLHKGRCEEKEMQKSQENILSVMNR